MLFSYSSSFLSEQLIIPSTCNDVTAGSGWLGDTHVSSISKEADQLDETKPNVFIKCGVLVIGCPW